MDDLAADLTAYLEQVRDEQIELLRRLVVAESPSLVPTAQDEIMSILQAELESVDLVVQHIPGEKSGGHLLGRPRSQTGTGAQLLVGHCDTVWPLGTLEQRPFAIRDDRMTGPGVYDMKAGLTQIIFALRALREVGTAPALQPMVFVNSDEEIGSRESRDHVQSLAREVDRALVLEPSLGPSGKLKTARKGSGRFTLTVKGRAAHAGLDPDAGASAILELSFLIQKLFALNDAERGISVNVGMIDGGLRPNVVAPNSSATVDVRVLHQQDVAAIEETIRGLRPSTPGVEIEVEGGMGRPPLGHNHRNRALWDLARRCGGALGIELSEGTAGGGSDGNYTSLHTATLDGLGAVGDGAHAEHEYVEIGPTLERTALLALLLASPT
ncbi:MAG: M20 family metallopeptidase [Acidimicrobiales bacterium]